MPVLATPQWATDLLIGRIPREGSREWDEYISWKYFNDHIPGLPDTQAEKYQVLLNAN